MLIDSLFVKSGIAHVSARRCHSLCHQHACPDDLLGSHRTTDGFHPVHSTLPSFRYLRLHSWRKLFPRRPAERRRKWGYLFNPRCRARRFDRTLVHRRSPRSKGLSLISFLIPFFHLPYILAYSPPCFIIQLGFLLFEIIAGLALGLIPGIDNFSHIGGFSMGLLLSLVLFPVLHQTRLHRFSFYTIRLFGAIGAIVMFTVLYRNFFTTDPAASCNWCRYLSCWPTSANNVSLQSSCHSHWLTLSVCHASDGWEFGFCRNVRGQDWRLPRRLQILNHGPCFFSGSSHPGLSLDSFVEVSSS